uniref:Uncharacterized protein n=1 Tax=Schizaphis graminum TaxID=13262 RepID=A0A2S2NGC9_SCHGA
MCSISNKVWKNTVCIWELSRKRNVPMISRLCTAAVTSSEQDDDKSLTKDKAHALVMNLTSEERDNLAWCLNHYESEETKEEYRGSVPIMFWTVYMSSLFNNFNLYSFIIPIYIPTFKLSIGRIQMAFKVWTSQ